MTRTITGGHGPMPTPVTKDYLGTATANNEPSVGYGQRKSRCYELAAYAIAFGDVPKGSTLVHGVIDGGPGTRGPLGHAWLVLPGGLVWEPILGDVFSQDAWYVWAKAVPVWQYTEGEAQAKMIEHEHYGPWETMPV